MSDKRQNDVGLGLMELLISIAIMMFIAIGLAGAMGLGVNLFSRTDKLSIHADEITHRVHLRSLLSQAIPPAILTTYPKEFVGTQNQISFHSIAETPFEPSAAASKIKIIADNDTLVFQLSPIVSGDLIGDTTQFKLASNTGEVLFSYFGISDNGERAWFTQWSNPHKLPQLVKITAPQGSQPEWPEFVVRLTLGSVD
jgi:hypothetical protein